MSISADFGRNLAPSGRGSAPRPPRGGTVDLDRLGAFLRRRHPTGTADHVAAATGVPAKTVTNWLAGRAAPCGAALIALVAAYGPAALAAAMPAPPAWLDESVRAAELARLEAEAAALAAEIEELRR